MFRSSNRDITHRELLSYSLNKWMNINGERIAMNLFLLYYIERKLLPTFTQMYPFPLYKFTSFSRVWAISMRYTHTQLLLHKHLFDVAVLPNSPKWLDGFPWYRYGWAIMGQIECESRRFSTVHSVSVYYMRFAHNQIMATNIEEIVTDNVY